MQEDPMPQHYLIERAEHADVFAALERLGHAVLAAGPIEARQAHLDAHGTPAHPSDLLQHTIVSSSALSARVEWRFGPEADPELVRMKPRLTVSSNHAALSAALGGLGITRLLSYQVAEEVERGALRLLLKDFEEESWPVHVVHRETKYGSSKVRSFIDEVVASLRAHRHLRG